MWRNDDLQSKSVEKFLKELKMEQIEYSEKGDYLWDFSGFIDKSSRIISTDPGLQNPTSPSPSSSSILPLPFNSTSLSTSPSTSTSTSIFTTTATTTLASPAVLTSTATSSSRQSMQRSVNLNESSRAKFVCVTNNYRANEKVSYEQGKDKDKDYHVNEKDLLVFDGHNVRNAHIILLQ